jgi:nucleotide-binding universal stress UspA family protein
MTDKSETQAPESKSDPTEMPRTFLLVVDASAEMRAALRFACRRAIHTDGRVALFHAVEPADFHHFASIGELMETEARSEAEKLLQRTAADVQKQTGKMPSVVLREGDTIEQLLAVLEEEKNISVLVLGASAGDDGPGPLVTALSGRLAGKINLPVTIVPGGLDDDAIDEMT